MNKKSSNEVMVTPYGHIYELEKGTIKKRCGYCKFAEPRVNAFLHCVTCHFAIKCCNELTKNQMKLGDTLVERAEMFYKFTKERA